MGSAKRAYGLVISETYQYTIYKMMLTPKNGLKTKSIKAQMAPTKYK